MGKKNEFLQLRMPCGDIALPSCINWKWIEVALRSLYTAHYSQDGKCKELGEFESATSANFVVAKAICSHMNAESSESLKDCFVH